MDSQGQFNVSHLLGSAVDVAHYGTLQHPLQGYSGTIATVGGSQGAGPVPPGATITLGYSVSHPPQPATAPPYVSLAPQVSGHPQIQYYYEAPDPLGPHLQVRYNTSAALSLQPATAAPSQAQPPPAPKSKILEVIPGHQPQGNTGRKRTPGTEGASAKLSRKHCRNHGEAYVSASGKFVPAKNYVEQDCQCRNKCLTKLGTTADREAVFRRFWDIGDFGRQNAHLGQSVVMVPREGGGGGGGKKQRPDPPLDDRHLRTVRRIYYVKLQEGQTRVRVCKSQFLRLHGVSNGRLDRVLQALHCEHPHALKDRRGQHAPSNKTAQEDLELATQHIQRLHKQRPGTSDASLTQEGSEKLSVKKMHELYQRWCEGQGRTPVSLWVYRQVKARLNPQQGDGDPKAGRLSDSLAPTCRSEDVATGHQEAMLGLDSVSVADAYKHTVVSTVLPKPTPTTTRTHNTTSTTTNATNTSLLTTAPATTTIITQRKRRRRRRHKQSGWQGPSMSREERKACRNKGEAYVTSAGKLRERKVYQDEPCHCRHRCIPALGTPETRQQVFERFWGLASFTRQNAHIAQMVTLAPLSHRPTGTTSTRTYSRMYNVQLKDREETVRVCKLAFLQLHGVSNGRVDRVLQAVACRSPFALKDCRGCHTPTNKTQEEDVNFALSHMSTFTLEDSEQPGGRRLPRDLNVEKMYRLYRELCVLEGRKPVGSFIYRKVLKERLKCQVKTPSGKKDLTFACQRVKSCERTESLPSHQVQLPCVGWLAGWLAGGAEGPGSEAETAQHRVTRGSTPLTHISQ